LKIKELIPHDKSFELISGDLNTDLIGICDHKKLKPHHLYFCKNKKFLEPALTCADRSFGLVIEKSCDFKDEVNSAGFLFVAEVESVALSICYFSKPFFDFKNELVCHDVDGRKMGTAQIDVTSVICENVFIGGQVEIGEYCTIHPGVIIMSDCHIGNHCEIFPGSVLHPGTRLGNRVRISSNTTIGSDGFGYQFSKGIHHKIWHFGGVVIDDDVEVGSSCSIDQGTFSPTIIGAGSKIDNQVHIAHNVTLGKGVILCAQVGLSGSCSIGDFSVLGGKAGVAPDVVIGAASQIAGNCMVTSSFPANAKLGGHPARPLKEWLKGVAYVRKHSLK
jgi:UDP-3-O-[3-hydroxymyristoyl] glucosamine N-acyltransferase